MPRGVWGLPSTQSPPHPEPSSRGRTGELSKPAGERVGEIDFSVRIPVGNGTANRHRIDSTSNRHRIYIQSISNRHSIVIESTCNRYRIDMESISIRLRRFYGEYPGDSTSILLIDRKSTYYFSLECCKVGVIYTLSWSATRGSGWWTVILTPFPLLNFGVRDEGGPRILKRTNTSRSMKGTGSFMRVSF